MNEDFNFNDFKKFPFGYDSKAIGELSAIIKKDVDFIILNKAPLSIIRDVLKSNLLIWERDKDKRVAFEVYNHKLVNDAENIRRIKRYSLDEKLKNVSEN